MAVLALLLGRHLAKRLPCPWHQEDRVVAKTRLAPPLRHDLAAALALEELRRTMRRHQRDHAYESRQPWPRHPFQVAQQSRGSFLLRGSKARRPDSRKSTECIEFDSRVIAQRRQTGPRQRGLCLEPRIVRVRLPHLVDLAVERDELQAGAGQQVAVFAKLAGVTRSDDEARSFRQAWRAALRRWTTRDSATQVVQIRVKRRAAQRAHRECASAQR